MIRLLIAILLLACSTSFCQAQAPEKVQGKTAAEWADTLRTNKDLKFRRVSLVVLGVFGPRTEGVLPAVTEALEKDPEEQIRREAAILLERMGPEAKGSVYALGEALKSDKSPVVREAAASALKGSLNPFAGELLPVLAHALKDSHPGTQAAASQAIYKLGDKATTILPAIIEHAKDPKADRFSRQFALKTVARLGSDDRVVADLMISILRDRSSPVALREESAEGLSKSTVATDVVIPPLAELLTDPVVEIRRSCAAALVRQGKDAEVAWAKIDAAFNDPDQAVRYQLIRVAGQLAKTKIEAVKTLIHRAQKDPHAENRLAAIQELGQVGELGRGEANACLVEISENDTNAAIRTAAQNALKKLNDDI